jgi:hypothetical protein
LIPSALSTTLGKWRPIGLIVFLGLFFLQAVAASPHNLVTFDEPLHITLGHFYLKTGDLSFHRSQSPPLSLFESTISLPLLLRSDLVLPTDHPSYMLWKDMYLFSDQFLWHANSDAHGIVHSWLSLPPLPSGGCGMYWNVRAGSTFCWQAWD